MSQNIIHKFTEAGILVNDNAYDKINQFDDPVDISSSLIADLIGQGFKKRDLVILTSEMVDMFLDRKGIAYPENEAKINDLKDNLNDVDNDGSLMGNSSETLAPAQNSSLAIETEIKTGVEVPESLTPVTPEIEPDISETISESSKLGTEIVKEASSTTSALKPSRDREYNFEILQDTSKKSYTSGDIKDMISYFGNRYHKIKNILVKRKELKSPQAIADIFQSKDVIKIIGMVKDLRTTKNNHKILEIEDETGEISVLVHNDNHKLFEKSELLVRDEVLGIIGSRKGNFVIASEIIQPGVPRIEEKNMDFSVVFISDVHIGSCTFLEESFNKFISWINGDFGSPEQIEIANDVKYLVVAGDIVDGIGVYPHQDKELTIKDITLQYDEAARLFGKIRQDIKIIIAPGNHDASRVAEPQPAVPEEYAKSLYQLKNVEFVSNPAIVSLDGIKTLIYHGRSFDDLAMTVKGLSHEESDLIMRELLEKRHIAPIYGERTPLASEIEDHLVIEEIPHIFHTGHVHINSYKKYKGVHMINSGTFQSQTEFQKIYNIIPTCGEVPVLHRGNFKLLKFS